MDYKARYDELLAVKEQLEKELEELRAKCRGKNEISRDMTFNFFHSASYLMAISKLDTGQYVDVNEAFLQTLGYTKDEIIGKTSDDIQIFSDFEDSNKYIKLISRLKKIKAFPVTLKTKNGESCPFLFSAETITLKDEVYLLTVFNELDASKDKKIAESQGSVLDEIFETISSYLALYRIGEDNKIYIIDLNRKVEAIEFVRKDEVIGKCIEDTILIKRVKLVELLNHIRITGSAHKLAASPTGDDREGYYMGFPLTSGNIVITWEPGYRQKNLDDFYKQGVVFEKVAEMLPEMIYEVDISGKILFGNQRGIDFFGYSRDDLEKGIYISDIFPENYESMIKNLKALDAPGETSSNEYIGRKKDGTTVPIVTHSFATFLDDKKIGYRGVVTDISKQKEYENQIIREKAFLEHIYNSTPAAIAITNSAGVISMINREFTNFFTLHLKRQ